jgi:PhnB protein
MCEEELMSATVKPVPDGFAGATPYLIVRGASSAIDFYKKAFGAKELMRLPQPDGTIAHAEIKIGAAVIMLTDESPSSAKIGTGSPQSLGASSVVVQLYVDDVDALAGQAVAAGARMLIPVSDQFYGDRSGRLTDPFGHVWILATHKEDVPPAQMQKRFEAMMTKRN